MPPDGIRRRAMAALDALLADGAPFVDLPARRLADAAGITRSTLYRHVPDRIQLLVELFHEAVARDADRVAAHLGGAPPAGIAEALRALILGQRRQAHLWRAFTEVAAYDPEMARARGEALAAVIDRMRGALEGLRRGGALAADHDVEATATVLVMMLDAEVQTQIAEEAEPGDDAWAASTARLLWAAVFGDSPAPTDGREIAAVIAGSYAASAGGPRDAAEPA